MRGDVLWRVFLGHTSELRAGPSGGSFVAAAEAAVVRAGHAITSMAYFAARDTDPADSCRRELARAHLYVGIIGLRYGSMVQGQPQMSYTELEFEAATSMRLPRLVFMLREDAVGVPLIDQPPGHVARQQRFRRRVLDAVTVAWVSSPAELEIALGHALAELKVSRRSPPSAGQAVLIRAMPLPLSAAIESSRQRLALTRVGLAVRIRAAARREGRRVLIGPRTIARWERGRLPHGAGLPWLAGALGVPADQLAIAHRDQEQRMNWTRRQMLGKAGLAGAGLLVGGMSWDSLSARKQLRDVGVDGLVHSLGAALAAFNTTDWLLGPRDLLSMVCRYLVMIDGLLAEAGGGARRRLLRERARYAEFASWLHFDSGDEQATVYWMDRAMEAAQESEYDLIVGYLLLKRSMTAVAGRNAAQVRGLALAGQRQGEGEALTVRARALVAQQEAIAHALERDEVQCHRAVDRAHKLLASAGSAPEDEPAAYCIPEYLEIGRAECWLELGQPQRAVDLFNQQLTRLPGVHRRDRGVYLARLAAAHAANRDPESSVAAATEALTIAESTGSWRITSQLDQLLPRWLAWVDRDDVRDADRRVRELVNAAP